MNENNFLQIINIGFELLVNKKGYSQKEIVNKLNVLEYKISTPAFNKIIKQQKGGKNILKIAAEGIQELIDQEIGFEFDGKNFQFKKSPGWKANIIDASPPNQQLSGRLKFYPEGRIKIEEKVAFISLAEKELIEVGVRLNTFTRYFFSRNKYEYRIHIENLLKRGVNVKLYLLAPNSSKANTYFEDRSIIFEQEKKWQSDIKEVIHKLGILDKEFQEDIFVGQFEVFLYKHIPQNHFLIVDGETPNGKMMVSHYLFGINRADCPVIRFNKKSNRRLFSTYMKSFKALAQNAVKKNFNNPLSKQ